jgi:hypothetical protein
MIQKTPDKEEIHVVPSITGHPKLQPELIKCVTETEIPAQCVSDLLFVFYS